MNLIMKEKICYTLNKPAITQMNCGVFTNKKILFQSIKNTFKDHSINFYGVLGYEKKIFNYFNLSVLLNTLNANESFSIRVTNADLDVVLVYEITIQTYNTIQI